MKNPPRVVLSNDLYIGGRAPAGPSLHPKSISRAPTTYLDGALPSETLSS